MWHTPLFLMAGSFHSRIPYVGFLISAVATSVMITWTFQRPRGSVLVTAVFHAVTDVAIAYFAVMSGSLTLFWTFVAVQGIAACLISPALLPGRDASGIVQGAGEPGQAPAPA